MSIPLSFGSNNIQVYAYEGFDFTVETPAGQSFSSLSNSSGLTPAPLYFFAPDASGNTQFRVSGNASTLVPSSRAESFTVTLSNGSNSVNTVTVNPGRFLDASSNTFVGRSYTFFRNEFVQSTLGAPFRLFSPSFKLKPISSIPSLPPGLTFVRVDDFSFDISGYPTVTVPNSNYQIIGVQDGGSRVITTRFNMIISNDRIQLKAVNPMISNMQVGTAITPCVITAVVPQGINVLRYTFSNLPDGIVVTDISGNVKSSPFFPSDPSYTLIISGIPTIAAAESFRTLTDGRTINIIATRTSPSPLVESSQPVKFTFQETVLFDTPTLQTLYTGVPVDPSLNFFRAQTYFPTGSEITSMVASSLPAGLSLSPPVGGIANLTGTPTTAGSATYTITASNANGRSRDYPALIPILNDVVTFVSPTPSNGSTFDFVISKPADSSNIRFVAEAGSKFPVTLSAPALAGTGLSLDSNGRIVGVPTTLAPLTSLAVTATAATTLVTATRTVNFRILDDQFTFADICGNNFKFVQNVPITPFPVSVTTLSERNVIGYTQTGLPTGITISPTGIISGTPSVASPTSGNATITATTGYSFGSRDFSYNLTPDSILFTVPRDSYSYLAGDTIPTIDVEGVAFSGTPVGNFSLSLPSSYGLTITNDGQLSGRWTTSIPPQQVLPSSCNFTISAQANTLTGDLSASLTANPILENTSFVFLGDKFYSYNDVSWTNITTPTLSNGGNEGFDIVIKNNRVDGNYILGTAANRIIRSTNAVNFSFVDITTAAPLVSKLAFRPTGTTWWVSGQDTYDGNTRADLKQSDNNGITWYSKSILQTGGRYLLTRNSNNISGINPYLDGGVSLAYKDGVMLVGGLYDGTDSPVMLRSTNEGSSWTGVTNEFSQESAYFNTDVSGMWIATGSDAYRTVDAANTSVTSNYFTTATDTIKYSTDQGATWLTTGITGAFNMFGYEIIYASNTWLATGVSVPTPSGPKYFIPELRWSSNGSNWTKIDLSTSPLFNPGNSNPFKAVAPLPLGSMNYDGSNWNVFVQRETSFGSEIYNIIELYSSPTVDSGNWTVQDLTSIFDPSGSGIGSNRFLSYTRPQYLRTSRDKNINITLSFQTGIGNGPDIVSPSSSILLYQYVPATIQVVADPDTLANPAYFFIASDDLPPGLTFNPLTKTISGKAAQIGTFTTPVYAKNNDGITLLNLSFTVIIPRIIRKQDGAGAYTSLLKQYTEVLGAQNARDSRVLPNQEYRLGEFMSPVPGDVVTAPFDPRRCKNCAKTDCPSVLESADGGFGSPVTCNVLDGNTTGGDFIDAGNAGTNVCD